MLNNIAQKMRKERFKNGAINFSSQEVRFKLDENGKPIGIVIKESKEAHQLIEEFMLLANRTVAEYVSRMHVEQKRIFLFLIAHMMNPIKKSCFLLLSFQENSGISLT